MVTDRLPVRHAANGVGIGKVQSMSSDCLISHSARVTV
jgi:hypothetical protein